MNLRIRCSALALAITSVSGSAAAGETVTYTYDALGRLIAVSRSGGSATVASEYQFDAAGNRTRVVVSGNLPGQGPSPGPPTTSAASLQVTFNGRFLIQRKR